MMMDYKHIEALAAVVEEGGFERAARILHITQSAVSQRIRALEEHLGQAVLVRTVPVRLTEAGERLMAHYRKVHLLETDMMRELAGEGQSGRLTLSIGVNEDSLATWLVLALHPYLAQENVLLDLYTDDQEETHDLLREGWVCGCVSTRPDPIQGCSCIFLGSMEYRCLCTSAFRDAWFCDGMTEEALRTAPAVTFNRKDMLHCRFVAEWALEAGDFPTHYVPSSEQFVELVTAGLAYGMVPHPQGMQRLADGALVDLAPDKAIRINLYWHQWKLDTARLEGLTRALQEGARQYLFCS